MAAFTARSPWQPNFSQAFQQAKMSFFCPFEMCHASQMGLGLVCINLFLLRGPRSPRNEYMGH